MPPLSRKEQMKGTYCFSRETITKEFVEIEADSLADAEKILYEGDYYPVAGDTDYCDWECDDVECDENEVEIEEQVEEDLRIPRLD